MKVLGHHFHYVSPSAQGPFLEKTVCSPKHLSKYYLCIYDLFGSVVYEHFQEFGGISKDLFQIRVPEKHLASNLWFGLRGYGYLHPEAPEEQELASYQCRASEIPDCIGKALFTLNSS